ncbi:MAG TPA: sigma-70 family RNA polymerase sigma factor [Isosphaeraceae bacterium]|nr:sigma-70 family RNA polymerase sigma factor [Isosphaeraceae bacterium]
MDQTRSTLLMRVRDPADAVAWGEFVTLYEPMLTAYLRHRGLGPEDTRDVVQDVFARLVKSLPEFELERRRGRFRTWLWQVCRSALVDWARRRRRQARAEDAWLRRLSETPPPDQDDSDPEWGNLHRRRVLAFALERVRARSRPATWACFERHLLQGRPTAEVAGELGLSTNAVAVNGSRILDRVRKFCAEYLEELADGPEPLPRRP